MSETPNNDGNEMPLRKYCTDGKLEEGGIGKIKLRKTNAEVNGGEKRKWPMLCDTNPYIVDLLRNIFNNKKENGDAEAK